MADAAAEISPALIGTEFEPRQVSWTSKDVMLYALGVGGSGGRHPGRQDGTVSGQGCLRAMSDFLTTFGGQAVGDGRWEFELHKRFNGAFGGTNGGVLSSLSVFAARSATERQPTSIVPATCAASDRDGRASKCHR